MMNLKKRNLLLIILCILGTKAVFASSIPPWPTTPPLGTANSKPYYYYFDDDTVRTALIKVAQSFDVKVHFSDDLSEDSLNKKLSGRFKVYSPVEIYNKFSSNFALTWFYYSGILYISPNSSVTKNLFIAPEMLPFFKNVLNNDGLLDERFGWSEIPSEGMVVVSGPQDYINLIVKKMKKLNLSPVDQQFAVFRLKYASAVDTSIEINSGNKIVIPGVATILKTILQGNQSANAGVDNKLLQQVIEPLKNNLKTVMPNGNLPSDSNNFQSGNQSLDSEQRNRSSVSSPVIQADNRLNTIIIRDKSSNMSIYRALINLLDIPAPLIQVQVLILDIDQVKMNSAGINWWGNTGGSSNISGGFGSNNLNATTQPGSPSLTASYGNINPSNLIVNNIKGFISGLRFLESKGFAKTEAKTAVITIDNIAAVVNLTESFYTTNAAQSQQLTPIQAQMQMQVIPHVIYDGKDKKRIKLTVTLQDGNVEERTVNGMPTTLQGDLNSQAIVEEGSSLLLAGFTRKSTEQVDSKVPILGDIPVLGWLFKDKTSSNRILQRSYLITPQIIWSDINQKIPNFSLLNQRNSAQERQHNQQEEQN